LLYSASYEDYTVIITGHNLVPLAVRPFSQSGLFGACRDVGISAAHPLFKAEMGVVYISNAAHFGGRKLGQHNPQHLEDPYDDSSTRNEDGDNIGFSRSIYIDVVTRIPHKEVKNTVSG
jgi:hypothetical protein